MKFSEFWLREWVNPSINRKTLLEQITMSGFEVDSVKKIAGSFSGVLIGEIIDCIKYLSNNKKIYITKVNVGNNVILDIICFASNCRKGIKVATAIPGAILANNTLVNEKKILDIYSNGILCSNFELGINENYHEIIELPIDAPVGKNIRDYMNLDDVTIEINIPSNRADCFCIIGIAREIAAINNLTINFPYIKKNTTYFNDIYPIKVESRNSCPILFAQIIKNIDSDTSTPLWIKEKLRRCEIESINIITDIVNYVLLELGQPIHLFDLDLLEGDINIRLTKENETLRFSNKKIIKLDKNILVINDEKKILSIAGILDINNFSFDKKIKNILFISAYFNPIDIYQNTKKCNINTNYSQRFERGIDPKIQHQAIQRVNNLICEFCTGKSGPIFNKAYPFTNYKNKKIILYKEKIDRIIGYSINQDKITKIFINLGFNVKKINNQWIITIPSWRFDINIEEDLIEEILRIYGYHNIPEIPISAPLIIKSHSEKKLSLNRVKTLLIDKGYQEVITYSFINPLIQNLLHPNQKTLKLLNPISIDMSVMRLSLWTGLINTILYNQKRQQNNMRLFESGFCFIPDKKSSLEVKQDFMLSGVLTGNLYDEQWGTTKIKKIDFYDLKGDLESIFELTGILDKIEFRVEKNLALHPGQSAAIYLLGNKIGFLGMLHPNIISKLNLKNSIMIFEILWENISLVKVKPNICNISKYPANRRDISLIVLENIPFSDILEECKKNIPNNLVKINLFDVYRGTSIKKGYKSLSISFILQDYQRTLKEKDIVAIIDKCIKAVKRRFQAILRDLTYGTYKS